MHIPASAEYDMNDAMPCNANKFPESDSIGLYLIPFV